MGRFGCKATVSAAPARSLAKLPEGWTVKYSGEVFFLTDYLRSTPYGVGQILLCLCNNQCPRQVVCSMAGPRDCSHSWLGSAHVALLAGSSV